MFRTEMYTSPVALMRYDPAKNTAARTALSTSSSVDYTDTEVVRETATSKDGTKVPVNIIMKKGTKLDGSSPTVLSGYGGYGVSMQPGFSARRRIWIDQGGVLAIANIRGGSEFGDEWHLAGNLAKKQNVFDDFAAAMKHLVDRKYTSKEKLAIMGGSNGGLLMGAMLVQHPDMFKACVSSVGIYDMLRVELHPNGAFNVTEFGTVKNPEHYKAMRAYSPYHNVKDGAVYPPVLFLTGASDPRVDPYHSRKMTARLQEAEEGKGTVLLRTSAGGHGGGTPLSQRIEQGVDIYAFLFDRLGVDYKPVQKKGA
jgi:prolyl oligopeptidase